MFYEILGQLLRYASEQLEPFAVAARDDPFARRQVRRVGLLMEHVGSAWPAMFAGVQREIAILRAALGDAEAALELHDQSVDPALSGDPEDDPLREYRRVTNALDRAVIALHAAPTDVDDPDWARESLREIRRALGEAAEVQRQVLAGSDGKDNLTPLRD